MVKYGSSNYMNEKEHGKIWFKQLHDGAVPDNEANLLDAIEGELYVFHEYQPSLAFSAPVYHLSLRQAGRVSAQAQAFPPYRQECPYPCHAAAPLSGAHLSGRQCGTGLRRKAGDPRRHPRRAAPQKRRRNVPREHRLHPDRLQLLHRCQLHRAGQRENRG